jgi:hypothetical protein
MRFFALSTLILLGFTTFATPAQAKGFWYDLKCGFIVCESSGDQEFTRPELEDGKTPHNIQHEEDWSPQEWIDSKGSATAVVDGLYEAGIITDQWTHYRTGVPIIEVGQGFMRLGGKDKRRVMEFMDYTYKLTEKYNGTILIEHKASGDSIGVYTKEGLTLQ